MAANLEVTSVMANCSGDPSHHGVFFHNDAWNAQLAQLVCGRQSGWARANDHDVGIVFGSHICFEGLITGKNTIQP